jgi:glutaminase
MQAILDEINSTIAASPERGQVASYIPQLAGVDPAKFGIALELADGSCCSAGDTGEAFSIQSISKVFTFTMALERLGDAIWARVGREPSGDPFNSIVQLEHERGKPRNPFINAGAIAVADAVMKACQANRAVDEILQFVRLLAGDNNIDLDAKVAQSEKESGDRNASLAHFIASFGNLQHPAPAVLDTYYNHCSIAKSCTQLARAGRFLAADGVIQSSATRVISEQQARRINSLMLMCGHYDGSGEFAYRVGLPGKSGVGGGILAIAPSKASIAVWSPGLDRVGNSKLGTQALEMLVARTGWSIFGH